MAVLGRWLIFIFLIAAAGVHSTVFKDCGSIVGKVRGVAVAGCDKAPPCILASGTNISLAVNFTALSDTPVVTAVVHGIIAGMPVPFPLPQSDACMDCNLKCPLTSGNNYTYTTQIPVSASYPKIKVVVRWELKDDNGKDLFCIEIPSAIK